MAEQRTRFRELETSVISNINGIFQGPWNQRSIGLISLLLGFYVSSNLTVYYLAKTGQRPFIAFFMLVIIELLIRIRPKSINDNNRLYWIIIDNFRVGSTFAVVLEAFKLGS